MKSTFRLLRKIRRKKPVVFPNVTIPENYMSDGRALKITTIKYSVRLGPANIVYIDPSLSQEILTAQNLYGDAWAERLIGDTITKILETS